MTFNLIGLGLNKNSISAEALEALKTCDKVYLENYTVDFPYDIKELNLDITPLDRQQVEDESILEQAKDQNIALLVYGDALSATTHIQLILECNKQNIKYETFHNSSILTAIAETGLQLYKFGKTASMPNWKEHTNKPTSFTDIIKQNQSIKAHTLLLTDIGLSSEKALEQLEESMEIKNKIVIVSNAGTSGQKIFYDTLENLEEEKVNFPFCIIIPNELHFLEEEALNTFC